MNPSVTHIVRIDRRKHFASPTLPAPALQRLESVFRAASWWRDRWTSRGFRAAARDVLRAEGGLVLLGSGIKFDVPPPFGEMFEPIEVSRGLDDERDQLKILSGDAPTRQERMRWIILVLGGGSGLVLVVLWLVGFLRGLPPAAAAGMVAVTLIVVPIIGGANALRRLSGRWFLVPGAVAIVRRPVRRGQPARVTVLSRADTCLVYRYVHTGKTTILFLELWTHAGKRFRRAVTEREAVSVLAAWQSPLTPPADERLQELVTW